MVRRLTSCLLIAILLACPQLCRAELGCCVEETAAAKQPCCEHCPPAPHPQGLPTSDRDGDSNASAPQTPPDACFACCVCKGALISHASEVAAPEAQFFCMDFPAHDRPALSAPDAFLYMTAHFLHDCGNGVRIALRSLLC